MPYESSKSLKGYEMLRKAFGKVAYCRLEGKPTT